ncbi:glucose 1-dehydrogenase [Actinomadura sp. NAK00032]|uniref:SDR family NAD(P)-dependent oxidoreductase n=1 Tax=Actinomadura sp. NAK00032 TaxID=2742128 RepID=UPI00158FE9F6|nr:glucose 1-dehydrogenase [Actinomadura sp. NAK00032]QKW33004.1 glucose 1-dehydrogenase [Actinomadura sp. NAK00032]
MSSERLLDGRVAIVTGASRGIGRATARALHEAGAAVVLAARDGAALAELAAEIDAAGGRALAVPTDVTDPEAVERLVQRAVGEFGRLDAAVNNAAGGGHPPTPLAEVAVADFDSALAVTLRGVFLCMKHQIPAMLDTGGGAIVNMSSTAGLQAVGGLAGYVSSKFGLVGLTRTAALDYAEAGVRVNALAPGPIHTEQLERAGEQAREMAGRAMPMRRIGRPEEVAAAAVWLCSDAASFITGATLPIDGGKLAGMAPFGSRPASAPARPKP